jgi:hypothetical protein
MARSDEYKVALAFKELYPEELERRKSLPGYTPRRLLGDILEAIRVWARQYAPELFLHIQRQGYIRGGMRSEVAEESARGELTAFQRGNFYSKRGKEL